MTPDLPQNNRDQLEAKLTALLLGELPPHEEAALHRAMDEDPGLAELYDRLKHTIDLVRESATSPAAETGPQPAPLKLSPDRREKLLAHFKTVTPKEFVQPRRQKAPKELKILMVAAAIVITLLPMWMFISSMSREKMLGKRLQELPVSMYTSRTPEQEKRAHWQTTYVGSNQASASFGSQQKNTLSFRTWEGDNNNHYPMAVASAQGGASEYLAHPTTSDVPLTPGASTEAVVPSGVAGYTVFSDSSAPVTGAQITDSLIVKDANGQPIVLPPSRVRAQIVLPSSNEAGNAQVTMSFTPAPVLWTTDTHNKVGNITLANGSVQQDSIDSVRSQFDPTTGAPIVSTTASQNQVGQSVPLLGDVAMLGSTFQRESNASDKKSGSSVPVLYYDVSDLSRYFGTNPASSMAGTGGALVSRETVAKSDGFYTGSTRDDASGLRYVSRAPATNAVEALSLQDAESNAFTFADKPGFAAGTHSDQDGNIADIGAGSAAKDSIAAAAPGQNVAIALPPSENSPLISREIQTASTPDTPKFSGGFGGGGFGRFGPKDSTVAEIQKKIAALPPEEQSQTGQPLPGAISPSFTDRVQPLSPRPPIGGKQVEIAARFHSASKSESSTREVADSNQAMGFQWYLGNTVTNRQQVVASGGTQPADAQVFDSLNTLIRQDLANNVNNPTTKPTELASAEQKLESEKIWLDALNRKTGEEKVDKELPTGGMVTVIDPATATSTEKPTLGEKLRQTLSGKVERTARITVEQERTDIAALEGPPTTGFGYDPYFLQTEFKVIQSDSVLKKAAEKLNSEKSSTAPDITVAQLKKDLDLRAEKNSKLVDIGAKGETAQDAARIANAVADAYREYRSELYTELKTRGIKSLEEQVTEQQKKVQLAQANVDELRKSSTDAAAKPQLLTRTFKIDPNTFYAAVQRFNIENSNNVTISAISNADRLPHSRIGEKRTNGVVHGIRFLSALDPADDIQKETKAFFSSVGVDFDSGGKNISYDGRQGLLVIQGASNDLEFAEAVIPALNTAPTNAPAAAKPAEADAALPKPAVPPPTPQPEILTSSNAFSTFSLNVSDVSFKLAAAALEKGQMPDPASIRSEEFINAFDYRDPEAAPGTPVAFNYDRALYPFAHNRELLRFSLKTAAAGRQAGRPLNIVLLLDNSGSMERADRVNIIREALRVLAAQLQPQDKFSVVTFARTARLRVDGIPGNQAAAAADEIANLTPEGGTDLGQALDVAYETALHHYLANGDNRVILLTDGAANLGDIDPDSLKRKVVAQRQQGISLDCFGIGWEGYNDDLLEVLTRDGDGRYGFVNTPEEASTEFVTQIAGALHVAAQDVKVQVEFNPNRVTSYRQIGYAKHQLTKEQFRDNTVAAAQIAAQEAGNALYTIEINPQGEGSIGTVRIRYKVPATGEVREQAFDVPYTGTATPLEQSGTAMRLAATASAFSEWLAISPFADQVTTDQLLNYLNGIPQIYGADTRPQKLEWMLRQAKSISGK
jgi:Mg-chelatase subunit ChlD